MKTFVLVLYIYAGILANGDSVSIAPITGFKTVEECIAAGDKSIPLVKSSAKQLRYVCLEQTK